MGIGICEGPEIPEGFNHGISVSQEHVYIAFTHTYIPTPVMNSPHVHVYTCEVRYMYHIWLIDMGLGYRFRLSPLFLFMTLASVKGKVTERLFNSRVGCIMDIVLSPLWFYWLLPSFATVMPIENMILMLDVLTASSHLKIGYVSSKVGHGLELYGSLVVSLNRGSPNIDRRLLQSLLNSWESLSHEPYKYLCNPYTDSVLNSSINTPAGWLAPILAPSCARGHSKAFQTT